MPNRPNFSMRLAPSFVAVLKRERARLPRLRVLVRTRHDTAADQAWALAAGADGVLFKPAADALLLTELHRLAALDDVRPAGANGPSGDGGPA